MVVRACDGHFLLHRNHLEFSFRIEPEILRLPLHVLKISQHDQAKILTQNQELLLLPH